MGESHKVGTGRQISARLVVFLLTGLALSSCGGDQDSQAQSPAVSPSAAAPGKPGTAAPTTASTTLATTPIDLSTAYSWSAAEVPAVALCPWLSDASAQAAVRSTLAGKPLQRRRVNESECYWNVNAGFALKIKRTPLSESGPLSAVRYNMDVDAVLEPLDGPGINAAVLKDPTWDEAKPRPFGLGFDLQQDRILITVTGMQTSTEQLRQVAEEIAAAPAGPGPAPQAAVNPGPTLDPCVFDSASLVALFGGSAGESFKATPDMSGSICQYKGTLRAGLYRVTMGLQFSGEPLTEAAGLRSGYVPAGALGDKVFTINRDELEGPGNSSRGYRLGRPAGQIEINLMVSDDAFPEAAAQALIDNLILRTAAGG